MEESHPYKETKHEKHDVPVECEKPAQSDDNIDIVVAMNSRTIYLCLDTQKQIKDMDV